VSATKRKYYFWLEIDRGTENAETLRGKCVRYWRSYSEWDGDEAQPLFQVYQLDSLAELMHRSMQ
jgi:hypothetical protein